MTTDTAVVAALKTAATTVTADMTSILPVALGVFALGWGIKRVMRFFKSASN